MKRAYVLLALALLCATPIVLLSDSLSYEERLVRASLRSVLGSDTQQLFGEPSDLQALFVDYSDRPELVWKARIAISKYGDDARNILLAYGAEPEFQNILADYGEGVVPVIQYFQENEPFPDQMARIGEDVGSKAKEAYEAAKQRIGKPSAPAPENTQKDRSNHGPIEWGWSAVHEIREDGHNLLGEFAMDGKQKAKRIQVDRALKDVSAFFGAGLRTLETKYKLDQDLDSADLFWAGVDATVIMSTVKALRAVKFARAGEVARGTGMADRAAKVEGTLGASGKDLTLFNRTKLFANRLIPKTWLGQAILKGGAAATLIYVVGTHPSLLNSLFAELATLLGVAPLLVQLLGWWLLIFALSIPLLPIIRVTISALIGTLSVLVNALLWFQPLFTRPEAKPAS